MRSYLFPAFASLIAISAPLMAATPAEQLKQLFKDSDEAQLKRQPIFALFRGDLRYADRLGDFYTDAATEANYQADKTDLAGLARIDRSKLNPTDQIAYDTFKRNTELDMAGLTPAMRALRDVRPIDHFFGPHTFYPTFSK